LVVEDEAMGEVEEFQERAAAIKHTLEVAKQDYHLRMELDDRRNFMQIEWALWELCAQVAKLREQS
jgi:hypothetical protein